jgi:FKBP-type peptidyl-prolyl cis-trans isomerases 1
MIVNDERKTSPKQRIIIVLIAIFMLASTFALYAGIVLQYQNGGNSGTSGRLTSEEEAELASLLADYQTEVDKQSKELSAKYFDTFKQYRNQVKSFNAASTTNLAVRDLKVGTGREITEIDDVNFAAYYIGWLSDETIFDSSFDDAANPTRLNAPLQESVQMIQGWKEGIAKGTEEGFVWDGMRIGGIREITIPAALGYGSVDKGTIPPNSPLKFVVMVIDVPEEIPLPERLEELYRKLGYE